MDVRTPRVTSFFHAPSGTASHLVHDPGSRAAVVIDPVLDFDAASGRTATRSAEAILAAIAADRLEVAWVLETHVHADHLSAAPFVARATAAQVGIGSGVCAVQRAFAPLVGADDVSGMGGEFDVLFEDGATVSLGGLTIEVWHTPGHTPACATYLVRDAAFVGDTLFMPDLGTARADFPGGDPHALWRSIRRILALPPETRLFLCHDYAAEGREAGTCETTVAAERAGNKHVRDGITEDEFVAMRRQRDASLPMPALILPSVQVNIRGGRMPPPDGAGRVFLRLPVDRI